MRGGAAAPVIMELKEYFEDIIKDAVDDWQEINPGFLCSVRLHRIGYEGSDMFARADVGFAPEGTFIRNQNVWQYDDAILIIGKPDIHGESMSEVYLNMLECLNELFAIPRPVL